MKYLIIICLVFAGFTMPAHSEEKPPTCVNEETYSMVDFLSYITEEYNKIENEHAEEMRILKQQIAAAKQELWQLKLNVATTQRSQDLPPFTWEPDDCADRPNSSRECTWSFKNWNGIEKCTTQWTLYHNTKKWSQTKDILCGAPIVKVPKPAKKELPSRSLNIW